MEVFETMQHLRQAGLFAYLIGSSTYASDVKQGQRYAGNIHRSIKCS
jgi:hypothetical protein